MVALPDRVIVFEVKLTQTPRGISQLERLYIPVVRKVFKNVPVYGVMICKRLYTQPETLVTSWKEALSACVDGVPTWHWIGR